MPAKVKIENDAFGGHAQLWVKKKEHLQDVLFQFNDLVIKLFLQQPL